MKVVGNTIITLLLSAIVIIMLGIYFYEYIPSNIQIAKPNEYITETSTTQLLATIKEEKETLFGQDSSSSDGLQSAIIHSYRLDEGDLRVYQQSNTYEKGKADPFADIVETPSGSGTSTGNGNNTGNSVNTNTLKPVGDGTILNSTTSK